MSLLLMTFISVVIKWHCLILCVLSLTVMGEHIGISLTFKENLPVCLKWLLPIGFYIFLLIYRIFITHIVDSLLPERIYTYSAVWKWLKNLLIIHGFIHSVWKKIVFINNWKLYLIFWEILLRGVLWLGIPRFMLDST